MIGWIFGKRSAASAMTAREPAVVADRRDTVTVRDPSLFSEPAGQPCREFLQRVFSVPQVQQADIDPRAGTALIRFAASEAAPAEMLRELAAALACPSANGRSEHSSHLFLQRDKSPPVKVFRHGEAVTTWQVVHELPGRIRLKHDALFNNRQAVTFVEHELQTTFGILSVKAQPLTGSLLVHFNDEVLRTGQLLQIVEGILHDFHGLRQGGQGSPESGRALANTSVGVGALADFVMPALAPASAVLLAVSSRHAFLSAWNELRRKQPGTGLLYTAIFIATVLANGSFFAAALMAWLMKFWDRRSRLRLSLAQRQLLSEFQRQPRSVWLRRGEVEIEVPIEQVRWGNVISLRTGDMVPVDGIVAGGEAQVDERLVCGVQGLSRKTKGDWVYASSLVFDGSLTVKVIRAGQRTRAAAIGRMIEHASTPSAEPLKVHGEPFARRAVLPALATAGAGLMAGDLSTAIAIMRPDYATGPGIAAPLGVLQDLHAAVQCGIVVRDPGVFERLRRVDVVLLDASPDDHASGYAASHGGANGNGNGNGNGKLHGKAGSCPPVWRERFPGLQRVEFGLISDVADAHLQPFAQRMGADFCQGGLSPDDKAQLVQELNERGKRVAFVGDCQTFQGAARLAHVAISVGDIDRHEADAAHVYVLQPEPESVGALWEISQTRNQRKQTQYGYTLVPNLFCIVGAFFLDFTGLTSLLISNFGVWTVYRHGTQWMRGLPGRPLDRGVQASVSSTNGNRVGHSYPSGNGHAHAGRLRQPEETPLA